MVEIRHIPIMIYYFFCDKEKFNLYKDFSGSVVNPEYFCRRMDYCRKNNVQVVVKDGVRYVDFRGK